MALVNIYNCWSGQSGTLKAKFVGACLVAASQIVAEAPETENHANRLTWANTVLLGSVGEVEALSMAHLRYGLATNATLQSAGDDATDNDVQFVVNSQINTLATG